MSLAVKQHVYRLSQSWQHWDMFRGKNWEQKDVFLFHIVNKKTSCVGQHCRLRDCFCGRNLLEIACVSMRKRTIKGHFLRDRVDKIGTCFMGRIGNKKTCSCFTSLTKRRLVWNETLNFGMFFGGEQNYLKYKKNMIEYMWFAIVEIVRAVQNNSVDQRKFAQSWVNAPICSDKSI